MKVLIAVDSSEASRDVIEAAAKRDWCAGTEFLVLTVVAVPTAEHWEDWGLPVPADVLRQTRKDAQVLVQDAVQYLGPQVGSGVTIKSRVAEGHASDCIIDSAKQWKADLIMIGSQSINDSVRKLVLGSVAERVLAEAPCTVEITKVKHPAKGPTRPTRKQKMVVLY